MRRKERTRTRSSSDKGDNRSGPVRVTTGSEFTDCDEAEIVYARRGRFALGVRVARAERRPDLGPSSTSERRRFSVMVCRGQEHACKNPRGR